MDRMQISDNKLIILDENFLEKFAEDFLRELEKHNNIYFCDIEKVINNFIEENKISIEDEKIIGFSNQEEIFLRLLKEKGCEVSKDSGYYKMVYSRLIYYMCLQYIPESLKQFEVSNIKGEFIPSTKKNLKYVYAFQTVDEPNPDLKYLL